LQEPLLNPFWSAGFVGCVAFNYDNITVISIQLRGPDCATGLDQEGTVTELTAEKVKNKYIEKMGKH
jgi:hypothetical protein